MNCKEFEYSLTDRVNFKVHISFYNFPDYTGDIILKRSTRNKRVKTCTATSGPRFLNAFCGRWSIWFGYDPVVFLDTSGVTPPLGADQIEWPAQQNFKPWDETDPFYTRALEVWDATPIANKVFRFFIKLPEYTTVFIVEFEQARDGATGTITVAGVDPPVNWGDAVLTIEKK